MASPQARPGMPRIRASYRTEMPLAPDQAVAAMADEQSSGTFLKLAGETDALRERHAARVESVALPGALTDDAYHRAHVTLSWPQENIGASLPNLTADP